MHQLYYDLESLFWILWVISIKCKGPYGKQHKWKMYNGHVMHGFSLQSQKSHQLTPDSGHESACISGQSGWVHESAQTSCQGSTHTPGHIYLPRLLSFLPTLVVSLWTWLLLKLLHSLSHLFIHLHFLLMAPLMVNNTSAIISSPLTHSQSISPTFNKGIHWYADDNMASMWWHQFGPLPKLTAFPYKMYSSGNWIPWHLLANLSSDQWSWLYTDLQLLDEDLDFYLYFLHTHLALLQDHCRFKYVPSADDTTTNKMTRIWDA